MTDYKKTQYLLWLDLEMTGLDPLQDTILELAAIITDDQLNIVETGPQLILAHSADKFDHMDDWNKSHHTQSGLWQKALQSEVSLEQAQEELLNFTRKYFGLKEAYLAGNSIWQDRRFIIQHMPALDKYLHHRMLDVSTLKVMAAYWHPHLQFKKKDAHRALDDILESIAEFKFYKEQLIK